MLKKPLFYIPAILVIIVGAYLVIYGIPGSNGTTYEFGEVTRGNIENTVSATGTLTPVTTVEVGTQVSGTIDSVYVDYNDIVKKGQILAVLDTTFLKASVVDAEAVVERNEAELSKTQFDYDRNKTLLGKGMISEADFLLYEANLKSQKAQLKSARASLDRAKTNLQYAVIRSPIDGIVISRNVEAGQTVAASLSTPTLFVIAEDLSAMEILADVDESDIGMIKEGQQVRFEVAAYNDREFTGKVVEKRLQPTTVSNVVTYVVVVQAANKDGLLLPGMTATLDFITDERDNVLLVPNKALRFQPPEKEMQAYFEKRRKAAPPGGGPGQRPDSLGSTARQRPAGGFASSGTSFSQDRGMVWYLDSLGQLAAAPFKKGISDNTNTEVAMSRSVHEGMKVIIGEVSDDQASAESNNNRRPGMFRRPPRF